MSQTSATAHPDVEIVEAANGFRALFADGRHRFRYRRFSGEWSGRKRYDVLRRGQAVGIALYDPDRDTVVLIEQFRLPALLAGASPWQIEVAAGLIDADETPEMVAVRETREETGLAIERRTDPDPALPAIMRRLGRKRFSILCPRRFDLGDRRARRGRQRAKTSASWSRPCPKLRPCSTPAPSRTATPSSPSIGCYATASKPLWARWEGQAPAPASLPTR